MGIFKKIRVGWLNGSPCKQAISITTKSGEKYWISFEDDEPFQINVGQYGKPCGYLRMSWSEDEIFLDDIHIFEGYQWNGLGTALLQFFIQFAREKKIKRIDAIVAPEDGLDFDRIMNWYIKNGFQRKSTKGRAIFMDNPIDQ